MIASLQHHRGVIGQILMGYDLSLISLIGMIALFRRRPVNELASS